MDTKISLVLGAAGVVAAVLTLVLALVAIVAVVTDVAVAGVVTLVSGARGFGRLLEWWVRGPRAASAPTAAVDGAWLGDWLVEVTPRGFA